MAAVLEEKTSRQGLEALGWDKSSEPGDQTGWELGRVYRVFFLSYPMKPPSVAEPSPGSAAPASDIAAEAAALAIETPQVEGKPGPVPRLSGNLAEDVHDVCGLTWEQIAQVFKVSERAAAGWRMQGVPSYRQETMEALRAIGVTLVGGLGPEGVSRWLTTGSPSRLQRMRDGEVEAVAEEARSYLDGPAT